MNSRHEATYFLLFSDKFIECEFTLFFYVFSSSIFFRKIVFVIALSRKEREREREIEDL